MFVILTTNKVEHNGLQQSSINTLRKKGIKLSLVLSKGTNMHNKDTDMHTSGTYMYLLATNTHLLGGNKVQKGVPFEKVLPQWHFCNFFLSVKNIKYWWVNFGHIWVFGGWRWPRSSQFLVVMALQILYQIVIHCLCDTRASKNGYFMCTYNKSQWVSSPEEELFWEPSLNNATVPPQTERRVEWTMFSKMTTRTFQTDVEQAKEHHWQREYIQIIINQNNWKQMLIHSNIRRADIEYLEEHKDYIPLCVEQESRTVTDMNKSQRSHL